MTLAVTVLYVLSQYVFATTHTTTIHPRLMPYWESQMEQDRDYPQFAPDPATMIERTPLGTFTLKTLLHSGVYSAVFTVNETRTILIKYQCDCDDPADLHPILRDGWISTMANEWDICPKTHYISPPVALPVPRVGKFGLKMSQSSRERCAAQGGTVRYMVMERVLGESLSVRKFRLENIPFLMSHSVAIVIHVLAKLRTLHDNGIVHGDVHTGNVLISSDADGYMLVHLIDFGLAFFDEPNLPNHPVFEEGTWLHELTSPWQLQGYPWSKRDDVYRAVDMLARLINGQEYMSFVRELKNTGHGALLTWRMTEFLFEIPPGTIHTGPFPFDPTRLGVDDDTAMEIRRRFRTIWEFALDVDNVNDEPAIIEIQTELMKILTAVFPQTKSSPTPQPPQPIDGS